MADGPSGKKGAERLARRLADQLGTAVEVRPKKDLRKKEIKKHLKVLRQLGAFGSGEDFLEPSGCDSEPEEKPKLRDGWSWRKEEKIAGRERNAGRSPPRYAAAQHPGGLHEESRGETPGDIYGSGFSEPRGRRQREDHFREDYEGPPRVAVALVRCESHSRLAHADHLARLFSASFYAFRAMRGEELSERERVLEALDWGREKYPQLPLLLVKDSSMCNISSGQLEEKVGLALERGRDVDLCYFGRWEDKCQQQQGLKGGRGPGSVLRWTYGPQGLQSALFYPSGRDVVLGLRAGRRGEFFPESPDSFGEELARHIASGNLKALSFSPNLLDYDISLATTDEDYRRRNECQPLETQRAKREAKAKAAGETCSSPDFLSGVPQSYIWIGILLFVVFVVAILVAIAR